MYKEAHGGQLSVNKASFVRVGLLNELLGYVAFKQRYAPKVNEIVSVLLSC